MHNHLLNLLTKMAKQKSMARQKSKTEKEKMHFSRKAQVQTMETIAILFIFFFLLGMGAIFYVRIQKILFQEKQAELAGTRALEVAALASHLPELICSKGAAEPEAHCIDGGKLAAAQELMKQNRQHYFVLFGYAQITVRPYKSDGTAQDQDPIVLYNYELPDEEYSVEPAHFIVKVKEPFAQENPALPEYALAVLTVETFYKSR